MPPIIVSPSLARQLASLCGPVELCDLISRVLGRFIPATDLSGWEPISPELSQQELDRRAAPMRSDTARLRFLLT